GNRHSHLAVPEIGQRFIDLVVSIALGDQILELDATLHGHLKNLFHVVGLAARHPGDGNFPGDEIAAANREGAAPEPADDRRRAARPRHLNDLVRRFWIADRYECFVDTALRELDRRFYWIF